MSENVSKILLKVKAVSLRVEPPFRWVSGILSPIYTDNRLLMSYTKERKIIVDLFLDVIKTNKLDPDVIAGIATSGIPWAAWIADKLNLPMVYIRKAKKEHGKENLIEGKLEKGQKVVIIEDLISTGGSSLSGVKAVEQAGCEVAANLAIFSYELSEAKNNFRNVKLITLSNITTLVNAAEKENYISKTEKDEIMEWMKNPAEWRK
ncbi:MAG: orotate phosphoribosyltransferase [Nanoarchaeota archaeon]